MSIFRLSVRTLTEFIEDFEGQELADLDRAMDEAPASARDIWADGIRRGQDRRHWRMEIADQAGRVLRTLAFAEAARPEQR